MISRRRVLQLAGAAVTPVIRGAVAPKRILILGGTGFLGPATVAAAQSRGHQLTLFNRGRTRPGLFPDIETLHGDRDPKVDDGLKALADRTWDVVIDNSGQFPRHVSASARLLAPNVKQYVYISSISAYAANDVEGADETAPLATMADPTLEDLGKEMQNYGALKALCEHAAEQAMPGRTTIVRPGFIVGPDDPSGRFAYWPVRLDRGGDVLAPGTPADPIQFIDVRDLGEWLIHLAEQNTTGVFNATGPEKRLAWGEFLENCRREINPKCKLIWVPADFVKQNSLYFPIWVRHEGATLGFHMRSIRRALAAGLRSRPALVTARDTLAWYKSAAAEGRRRLAGPSAEKEEAVLAAWRKRDLPV